MDSNRPSPRRDPGPIPTDMKAFNRALVEEFRANHGRLSGPMAGRSLMLLTTTGARTGQARTVVLGYGRQGDRYVAIASANAAPADPAWYRNLQEHPIATVEVNAERSGGRAGGGEPARGEPGGRRHQRARQRGPAGRVRQPAEPGSVDQDRTASWRDPGSWTLGWNNVCRPLQRTPGEQPLPRRARPGQLDREG